MGEMNDTAGELNDSALREEIELLAEAIDAATQAGHRLCPSEIDRALHVEGAHQIEYPEG